jgi:hypothetical protein
MFRRVMSSVVFALAFVTVSSAVQAASPSKTAPADKTKPELKKVTTGYTIYYRRPNTNVWTEHETRRTYQEADTEAKKLQAAGFQTQLQAKTAMIKVPPRPKTPKLPESETVTMKQLGNLFSWMASQRDIAFRYPTDGCYARAHLMIQRMQEAGFHPYKVWTQQNGDPLYVRTRNHPNGYVTWRYHVAPILRVRFTNGEQAWYVVDPSLFSQPVTIANWRDIQKKPGSRYTPFVTLTRLGQAPTDINKRKFPGSGYWLGKDPVSGPNTHAVLTMRKYKPYEGRMPPKSFAGTDEPVRPTELARMTGPSNRTFR